jgi:hypothetical protein
MSAASLFGLVSGGQAEAMADRSDVREALVEDVRSLAGDLRALLEDPKERKRKERMWAALYGGLALGFTLIGRRLAVKAWSILTGEQPPVKAAAPAASPDDREPVRS